MLWPRKPPKVRTIFWVFTTLMMLLLAAVIAGALLGEGELVDPAPEHRSLHRES
jgi:hypothetical protein